MRLTLALAVLAATADILLRVVLKVGFTEVVRVPRQALWVVPTGYLLLFLPLAFLLWLAGRAWPRAASPGAVVFTVVLPALVGLLALVPRLHAVAVLLLAGGLAYRIARVAAVRGARFADPVVRAALVCAILLASAAIAVEVAMRVDERRDVARLPAAPAGAPNVILLIWDTVRSASLGLYGHERPTTPNLERLAREGVVFSRAYAPAPWTLPSHASMFTGRIPPRLPVSWDRPLDRREPTLAERLARRGYRTGGFAANLLYVDWEHGLARGFQHYEDYRITPARIVVSTGIGRLLLLGRAGWGPSRLRRVLGDRRSIGRSTAQHIDERVLRWIDRDPERPFFVFANYFDAHLPYDPPAAFASRFGPRRPVTTVIGCGASSRAVTSGT